MAAWGGVPYGFRFAPLPANDSVSCLVKLTSRQPYTESLSYPIGLAGSTRNAATGGVLLSDGTSQTRRVLTLSFEALFRDGFE